MDRLTTWVDFFINKGMDIKDPVNIVLRGNFLQTFLFTAGISACSNSDGFFLHHQVCNGLLLISIV